MNIKYCVFFSIVCLCFAGHAGFLQPTTFPKVAEDLSFIDKIRLRTDGYAQIDTVYDENGKCISGCAYAELNLEDELSAMARRDALLRIELVENYGFVEHQDGHLTPSQTVGDNTYATSGAQMFPGEVQKNCAVSHPRLTSSTVPYGSPLGYVSCIVSDYGVQRKLEWDNKTNIHRGIDLRAAVNTPVYAPADGTVIKVFNMNESCGNGVIIQHAGGFRTQYCHFTEVLVGHSEKVSVGCLIGKVGSTGHSTGPHLHYAVQKWNGKAYQPVDPKPFLEPEHTMCSGK